MPARHVSPGRIASQVCQIIAFLLFAGPSGSASTVQAQEDSGATAASHAGAQPALPANQAATSVPVKGGKKGKQAYTGPTTIIVLPPTPMLDLEGKQRVDPDGKLMFNPPVKQIRDKKGHPVFGDDGKPIFQTATNLGYDEKGKKIAAKKEKPPKMTPVSITGGTLTVDGWTGKARLNYDIADLKYLYIYAPGIGITIVSQNPFPGAKEQPRAFDQNSLSITVDGHPIELSSEKRLLGKKPEAAWVVVDRGFLLPSKFPVFGYGTITRPPYAWPGSKESIVSAGVVHAPPLPTDVRPTLLLAPCPAGMMRPVGPPVLPGQKFTQQTCIPISSPVAYPGAAASVKASAK